MDLKNLWKNLKKVIKEKNNMAGKSLIEYWFKKEKRLELLKDEKIYVVAERIGIDNHYLTNIINRKMAIKHKAMAYAITKYTNSNYEIEDVFDKKDLR